MNKNNQINNRIYKLMQFMWNINIHQVMINNDTKEWISSTIFETSLGIAK